eukprot:5151150-Prorocentrum_lima.AAC.1
MTSSLVGSEMCIRDSSISSPGKPSATPNKQSRQQHMESKFMLSMPRYLAVSYTHLTLPTICSV